MKRWSSEHLYLKTAVSLIHRQVHVAFSMSSAVQLFMAHHFWMFINIVLRKIKELPWKKTQWDWDNGYYVRLRHGFVSPASRWKVCIPGYICLRYCRKDSWIPRPQWLISLSTLRRSGYSKSPISKNKGKRGQIRHITWASSLHKHTYARIHMCMCIPTWICTYNTHIYTCKFTGEMTQ